MNKLLVAALSGLHLAAIPYAASAETIALPSAEQVSSVTLALVPDSLYTRAPLDESGVLNAGCTLASADRQQVQALLSILSSAIVQAPAATLPLGYRRVIHLHLESAGVVKILTGPSESGRSTAGVLRSDAEPSTLSIAERAGTRATLMRWANSAGTVVKYPEQISLCKQVLHEPFGDD